MAEPGAPRLATEEVARALAEDCVADDVTTALLGPTATMAAVGHFIADGRCVVAGVPVVSEVFRQLDTTVRVGAAAGEGAWVDSGTAIATVEGEARVLLAGERVSLNFLQRLSGIATATRQAVEAIAGTDAIITDTRKTTPGLRALEKYAVRVGGGSNHRRSLGDGVLFKDNHWVVLKAGRGRLVDAIRNAPHGIPLEVEVETEEQLTEAIAAGVTRILADNQPPKRIAEWVRRVGPGVAIEASGGITPETALAYAEAGARFISIGTLTHSSPAAPIAFALSVP